MKQKPDVIIAEGESNILNNVLIYIYSIFFKKKIIWWGLGLVPGNKESYFQRLYKPFMLLFLKRASFVIGYSEYSRNYYSKYTDKKKIVVANNCLDNEKVDREIETYRKDSMKLKKKLELNDKFVILFVGDFAPRKKIDRLLKAFYEVNVKYPHSALVVVGDGKTRPEYENIVRSLNINNVIFTGKIIEGVSKYFLLADLFVLPGLGGLSIHHAMIHSLPVISASADGTELDLIKDGRNGFILSANSTEELVDLIEKFLLDNTLSKNYGNKSREIVEKSINISNMVNVFINAINDSVIK